MWNAIGILTLAACVSFFEVRKLEYKENKRDLLFYFLFLSIGVAIVILLSNNADFFNPSDPLIWLFSPVDEFIEKILSSKV